MNISSMRDQAIDYAPCRYNGSRLWFRGPAKHLHDRYVACLGGSGIYGRYVANPWTSELEAQIGCAVVNLGIENAGIDAYLNDAGGLATAANADIVVIQLSCVHNTSNRFYMTHPRRNDRFLKAAEPLTSLYPEMDFTEVHFTRHMLARLRTICPKRFEIVVDEACNAWVARMRSLIAQMNGAVFLLWFAPKPLSNTKDGILDHEPFLTRDLIAGLCPQVTALIEVVPHNWVMSEDLCKLPPLDIAKAEHLPGPEAHRSVADAVAKAIVPMLK